MNTEAYKGEVPVLRLEQEIHDIEGFDGGGSYALSLYLDTDPSRGAGQNLRAELNDALRDVRRSPEPETLQDQLEAAARMALEGIQALPAPPRSVAAFACPEKEFLRVIPLPEPTDRSAHWGTELRIAPLLAALDEHERTVVVLVDQEHSRVFRVFMGQIEEIAALEHEMAKHAQAGRATRKMQGSHGVAAWMGYGETNLQRRHEWHVRQHLQQTLDAMRLNGDRLLVGGVPETVYELCRLLPRRVRERTLSIKGLDVRAPESVVLERVLEAQQQTEREEEEELVDNLLERDHARSVFGDAAVSEVVSDGRVHTLAYTAGTTLAGSECSACGWLVPGDAAGPCPRCGESLESREDLLERLVSRVIKSGGRVEEVRGPAGKLLKTRGGLAALLRYVPPTVRAG
jgi:peptide subunit release factor 1 (eRF1)